MGFFTKIKNLIMASTVTKVVAGAVVVVVLGGTGLVLANTVAKPENVLGAAVVKTFTKETPAFEKVFGLTEFTEEAEKTGAEMLLDVSVKDIPLDSLGLGSMNLPSVGFSVEVKQNPDGKEAGMFAVNVADATLASVNMYADEEQVQISAPELFQSVLSFSYAEETLKDKLKTSYFVELLELTEEEIDLLADSISGQTEVVSEEEMGQEMTKIFMECYEKHLGGTAVEKLDKEEVSVGEEVLKCKVFEIRMDAQNVNAFIKEFTERFVAYCKEISAQQFTMTEEEFAPLEEVVADWEPALQDEVVIKCFVTKGRLVDAVVNLTAANNEPCSLEVKFAESGYALDNMYFVLQTQEEVFFEMEIKTENTKEKYAVAWKMAAEGQEVELSFDYDKEGGEITAAMSVEELTAELAGTIKELKKGVTLDAEVDKFMYSDGTTTVSQGVDASFYMTAKETEIIPLSGNQMDLLSMTEDDFTALTEEISTSLTGKLFQLLGLLQ